MRRDYLIAIVLAVAALPAGAALMAAPDYLHLTGLAVPLTFWGGIALTVALIAVAAIIALRGERAPKVTPPAISPHSDSARDIALLDAIWRVYMGKWGERKSIEHQKLDENDPESVAAFTRFWTVCTEVRQKAFDGSLPVWARRRDSSLYEPLPLDFWVNRRLLTNIMMHSDWNETWVEYTHALVPGEMPNFVSREWEGFMTNKAIVDKLWGESSDFLQSHPVQFQGRKAGYKEP